MRWRVVSLEWMVMGGAVHSEVGSIGICLCPSGWRRSFMRVVQRQYMMGMACGEWRCVVYCYM